ncbi:hypothetical protein SB690_20255, partial [Bacillus sp. SIMBA_006]
LIIKSGKSDKEIVTGFGKTINLPFANIIIIKNKKYNFQSAKNIKTDDLELYISSLESKVTSLQGNLDVNLVNKDATVVKLEMKYPQ